MKKQNHKGQSLVEFAIMLPLFVLLLVATIQFGLVLANYVALNHAAVVGARTASVGGDGVAAAQKAAGTFIKNTSGLTVTPADTTVGGDAAEQITVQYNLKLIFTGFVLPNPLPISATSIMRKEQ